MSRKLCDRYRDGTPRCERFEHGPNPQPPKCVPADTPGCS